MDSKLEKAKEKVKKYNQEHVLKFYDSLTEEKKQILINQILETDFDLLNQLYNKIGKEEKIECEITPIPYTDKAKLRVDELEKFREIGENVIKNNKYAVVTMAGGQGTRLGHNGPKGTYYLDVNPRKSLFEIFFSI